MAELTKASSSTSKIRSSSYDVFLNFRGKDTRKNFISFLHKDLKERGINVFIDSEKLWAGEAIGSTICKAIEGSKISIPVFSTGYVHSKWCLRELVKILECHRSNGQLVLPIFFHVDPSHVRNQTGSFEEAFREHEKSNPDIVKSWREALEVVGNLRGEIIDETKDQAELVELVVKRVQGELISNIHLAECKYPIGIDSSVDDLLCLLNISSNDVQFVGICGFGGIGKTTIAKTVYNRMLLAFNRHSFLSDVREHAMEWMGLLSLQKRLLRDIFKTDIDIADDHRGKKLIEQRLSKEKVFVVLDDVDSQEQVDALAGELNWFGEGSRVIITTRDEHILNMAKVGKDKIYRPQVLDCKQSLRLFSFHAFSRDQPPKEYMRLAHYVTHYSGGLPLTLEVLGSYLSDISDKEEWKSTLQSLKEIPHEKVQRRLKISYDNLENDFQKAIFLDAACFFIGWEKETVISIWEACGYHPKSAMYRLIKRSLLKFGDEFGGRSYLKMHDQIRDMGREIVLEESRVELGKRSRLWSYEEILEVLEGHKGTGMIKGMNLPYALPNVNLVSEPFEIMPNLRFLNIRSTNFMGDFSRLPSALRCFKWTSCLGDILPPNFYHNRLVYLDISGSNITQAWNIKPQEKTKRFQNLKVLDLSNCRVLSKSPDFSWFPCLERLDLGVCRYLDKLDESIGQLSQLKSLILRECLSLKKLPECIGDLKSLLELDLMSTAIEELPDSISRMISLKKLILRGCSSLKKLPDSIGDLKFLVELQLSVSRIKELPDGVGLLEKLEILDAKDCHKLVKLPRSMGRMRGLHSIKLEGTRISNIPDDFSMLLNLKELEISCRLESLPADLSGFKKLKQLKLYKCEKLKYLQELPSILVKLCCEKCYSLIRLPDLSGLKDLRILCLVDCIKLKEIRGLEGTESLEKLDARGCYNLGHSPRKILGKGTLLPYYRSPRNRYSLTASDGIHCKGLILCIVFECPFYLMDNLELEQGQLQTIYCDISASIRQKQKTVKCHHTLRIEDVEFIAHRDIIYIHYFKGFDWFGVPLQGKDTIKNLHICGHTFSKGPYYLSAGKNYRVKFWEVLFEKRELDPKKPNQHSSAMMVSDFFNWSYFDDGVPSLNLSLTRWSEAEVERSSSHLDDEASTSDNTEEEEEMVDNAQEEVEMDEEESPSDNTEEVEEIDDDNTEEEEMDNDKESPSDNMEEEEERILGPRMRAYLCDNNDEASGPSCSLGLTCWPQVVVEGSNSVPKEKEEKEGVYRGACLDFENNDASCPSLSLALTLPCVVLTIDDGSKQQTLYDPSNVQENGKTSPSDNDNTGEEEQEESSKPTVDFLSSSGFYSVSDVIEEEGGMLRSSKRARLHDNSDEAAASRVPEEAERSNRTIDFIRTFSYVGVRGSKDVPEEVEDRTHSILQMRCSNPLIKKAMLRLVREVVMLMMKQFHPKLKAIERLIVDQDEVSPRAEEASLRATATPLVDEDDEAACPSPIEETRLSRANGSHIFNNMDDTC